MDGIRGNINWFAILEETPRTHRPPAKVVAWPRIVPIDAETGKAGSRTKMSGNPTYQELAAVVTTPFASEGLPTHPTNYWSGRISVSAKCCTLGEA